MTAFRSIKERAQRQVHAQFGVAALYRADPESEWVPVSVRVHERFSRFGDIPGLANAEFLDVEPKLVFLLEDIGDAPPPRGAIVSVSATEAWTIGESERADGICITARAARVPAASLGTFELPEAA